MKFDSRIFGISLVLGILAWIGDALMETYLFRKGALLEFLITDVPAEEVVHRIAVLALLLISGFIISSVRFRREESEQEAARKALEERERWFRDLAEFLPEPVFEADLSLRLTYANRRAFALFGYSKEDFDVGLHALDMLAPADREMATAYMKGRLEERDPGVVEYTAVRKDGSTFPVLFHGALFLSEGRPAGLRGIIVDISARKKAEEVLVESERRFRNIVESSPLGIFLYELKEDGRLVFAASNPTADSILGVDTSGFIGMTIEEAFPPLADTEVPTRYREAAATGNPWQTEQIDYDHGGISGAFQVSAFQTAPNEVAVMFLDITERKRAEEAVKNSEERLRLAARTGRVGVWDYEVAPDHLEWDDLMFELHGVDPVGAKEGIQRWRDCVHPDDLERAEGEFMASLPAGGPPFDTEFRIVRGDDGETRYLRGLATVFRDEDGAPVRAVGTNWDITESKQFVEALRDSEARFRSVIEQLNDATYILYNGRFDLVNPRFTELTGISAEKARDPEFSFWDLVAPSSVPMIEKRQELREKGEEVSGIYEFDIKHRDGHFIQVEASVTEIDYQGGKAILGLLRDITEQKSLEEQLLLSQRMDSIGRLSGGIAHDLNNLLTPILGYGDLLLSDLTQEDERWEDMQEIVQAAHRARDLVRQLLAFGRRQTMELKAIELNGMILEFQSLLRRTIREDIEIRFLPGPMELNIEGDRGQLEQVIMNLVVNAQDAMPGGGLLTIETRAVELEEEYARGKPGVTPGPYALLQISDTGEGMESETRDKIFEPFFTTKERGKGTGLGLATVYGIVKQHGGNIWVYTEPGIGTSFKCYLPLVDTVSSREVPSEEEVKDYGGSETVMVVEDEVAVRALTVKLLKRHGYNVLEAGAGTYCLDSLRTYEGPLDLLLTDVVMPGMNGRELYGEVVTLFPEAKVLYMSGYSEDIVSHRGVLDEGISFLEKPFSVKTLLAGVRAVLDEA